MRGTQKSVGVIGAGVISLFVFLPASAWAADGTAEAAEPVAVDPASAHIRTAIDTETDPELKAVMEEQLRLLESGELTASELGLGTDRQDSPGGASASGGILPAGETSVGGSVPGRDMVGPPIDIGRGGGTTGGDAEASLPPGAREELEKLFRDKGTGDPTHDTAVREEAEKILEKYGVDPRELGPGHEGDHEERSFQGSEVFDRVSPEALEHMPTEAREQMERAYEQYRDTPESYHETFERDASGLETERETEQQREFERAFEGEATEAPTRDSEAPRQEGYTPEQPEQESQPPQGEYEAQPSQP